MHLVKYCAIESEVVARAVQLVVNSRQARESEQIIWHSPRVRDHSGWVEGPSQPRTRMRLMESGTGR